MSADAESGKKQAGFGVQARREFPGEDKWTCRGRKTSAITLADPCEASTGFGIGCHISGNGGPMFRVKIEKAGFSSSDVERAAEILVSGGVGIIPTDTVYGLAALAVNEGAVERLLEIKERPAGKPPPVQISKVADADRLAFADEPDAIALMEKFWPGPLTLVLRRREGIDFPFQERENLALRMDSAFCLEL